MVEITYGPGAPPPSSRGPDIRAITAQASQACAGGTLCSFNVNPVTGVVAFGANPSVDASLEARTQKREAQTQYLLSRALGGTAQQLGLGLRGSTHLGVDELALITALRGATSTDERVAILKGENTAPAVSGLAGPSFAQLAGAAPPQSAPGGSLPLVPIVLGAGALLFLVMMMR